MTLFVDMTKASARMLKLNRDAISLSKIFRLSDMNIYYNTLHGRLDFYQDYQRRCT